MELTKRMSYLTFIIVGIIFIAAGVALNELDILINIDNASFDDWVEFLKPWIGEPESGGLPRPWENQ